MDSGRFAPRIATVAVDAADRPILLAALHAVAERSVVGIGSGSDRPLSVSDAAVVLDRGEPIITEVNGRHLILGVPDREHFETARYDACNADGLPLAAVLGAHLRALDEVTRAALRDDSTGAKQIGAWARQVLMLVNPARAWRVEVFDGVEPSGSVTGFPDEYRRLRSAYVVADYRQRMEDLDPLDAFGRASVEVANGIEDPLDREDAERLFAVAQAFVAGALGGRGADRHDRLAAWRQLPRLLSAPTIRELALAALSQPAVIADERAWAFD